jgi:hypothetical protein
VSLTIALSRAGVQFFSDLLGEELLYSDPAVFG